MKIATFELQISKAKQQVSSSIISYEFFVLSQVRVPLYNMHIWAYP